MSNQAQSMRIADLIRGIEAKKYYLPAIQREFVWPPDRIEQLFESMLRGYPIGTLLLWEVREPAIHEFQFYELLRSYDIRHPHNIKADLTQRNECLGILDGQQRVTAIYLGMLGTYTTKRPRLWWDNPKAFTQKRLYINLLYQRPPDEIERRYELKFLTEDVARPTDTTYWFPVGDILKYETMDALRSFRRSTPHRDDPTFQDTLEQLWVTVHSTANITYFLENGQDLDEVLEIFVRLNRGGMPLSYSDLLLSLATATWKNHDAREEVYRLVEKLNNECGIFNFTKDFVLKTSLVFSGGDVRFKAKNIRKREGLEDNWTAVASCLTTTVSLLNDFGFDRLTLTATNAAIPIAYYLYRRDLGDDYRTRPEYAEDRERIRRWLLTSLLARIFGEQADRLLTDLRRILQEIGPNQPFPEEALDHYLRRRGMSFSLEQVDAFVNETILGDPNAFLLLSLLTPGLNRQEGAFHMAHLHPPAHSSKERLAAAGLSGTELNWVRAHWNHLANLAILPDTIIGNQPNASLADWLAHHTHPEEARRLALIPDVKLDLGSFQAFYEARRQFLTTELRRRLGVSNVLSQESEASQDELVTDEAQEL
jgi:uncharacterized protein with ParB-like and HNH nuclease domain